MRYTPEKLKLRRKASGLSQEGLARAVHCCKSTISKYEYGECSPNVVTAKAIANVLGTTMDELFFEQAATGMEIMAEERLAAARGAMEAYRRYKQEQATPVERQNWELCARAMVGAVFGILTEDERRACVARNKV